MSTAGPPRGRLHERGEAKARSARPRVLAAGDTWLLPFVHACKEAARNCALAEGSAAAELATEAASVGVHP
jgi:hypothetical protein